MEIGKEYALNNGDIITVTQAYWHYESRGRLLIYAFLLLIINFRRAKIK